MPLIRKRSEGAFRTILITDPRGTIGASKMFHSSLFTRHQETAYSFHILRCHWKVHCLRHLYMLPMAQFVVPARRHCKSQEGTAQCGCSARQGHIALIIAPCHCCLVPSVLVCPPIAFMCLVHNSSRPLLKRWLASCSRLNCSGNSRLADPEYQDTRRVAGLALFTFCTKEDARM